MNNINDWPLLDKEKLFEYLRWNSYRSERYKLFYVATPKVACTKLKWWFATLEGYSENLRKITDSGESDPDLVVHDSHRVAPNVTGLMPATLSDALASDSYFRFAVVRNPYKRIFSAWQSKLLLQEPLQIKPYLQCEFFHYPIKSSGDIAAAFEGFLEHLAGNEAPSYWDHHWTPQAAVLRPDLINYSKLVKIEEGEKLTQALVDWLGEYIPNPFSGRRANESLIPYLSEFVTERSSELIRTLYAEDFDSFGYNKQPPKTEESFSADQFDIAIKAIKLIRGRHQRLGERNVKIGSLNQTVAERDVQIVSLNQAVAERDVQIVSLNQTVADRDGQIVSISQAVAERDVQIVSLNQAVTERDGQIVSLNQAVTDRDGQIHFQGQRIEALMQSRSWRWTTPLRLVTSNMRLGIRPLLVALNRSSARLPVIRQISIRRIRQSSLFDQTFYALNNPDVSAAGIDPATHYFLLGWREHRDPSEHFCTRLYLQNHPDVAAAGINPLLHYIDNGQGEGRQVSRSGNDLQQQPENWDDGPQTKEILLGADDQERSFDEVVDQTELARYENDSSSVLDHIEAEVGAISKSGLFDVAYYLAMYPDIQAQPADPIRHYCEHGWREGRNPSDDFDTRGYLDAYSDIKNANLNPFWHYVVAGISESRQATPDSSSRFEDDVYFGKLASDIQLVAYYATPDWDSVRRARKAVKGAGQGIMPHEDLGQYGAAEYGLLCKQALMARRHGICGWCFSFDAAHGPKAGEPISEFLANCDIDIRFCLDINLNSSTIDQRTVSFLKTALSDERYLRIDGHPVLVMSLPSDDSDCIEVLRAFNALFTCRQTLRPYRIARRNSLAGQVLDAATQFECEAILDLAVDPVPAETGSFKPLIKNGVDTVPYSVVVSQAIARIGAANIHPVPTYRGIRLGRDDAPINPNRPLRYTRFHMREYRRWLDAAIADTRATHGQDRRLVFINAWNDWNHGAVLEPDRIGGYSKLNETSRALLGLPSGLDLPKVSVIVPNYNHAPYLNRRLESIYRQTYRNIEVLLLDDCSADQSRAVLAEYAERYPEITKVLFNEENSGGVFRQWAKGIKAASGNLVWIAESDDYCDENFLEKLVRCFDDEAVMLAYSRVEFVRADESVMPDEFWHHVRDLECREKWKHSYVNTAHQEVSEALGIINTIPNASGAIFRRPVAMPLLEDEAWLSMRVVGDWVFYLHLLRGGKIAYSVETTNYFRRYETSTAASTYKKEAFYNELGIAAKTVQQLYDVPKTVITESRKRSKELYDHFCGSSNVEFKRWFDEDAALAVRSLRTPNIAITTQAFHPGGAEILPIRMANELKRKGYSVLLFSIGLNKREDGIRRMLRSDVPVVETSDVEAMKRVIQEFGIEVLNSHQWHVQKYPIHVSDVFRELKAHVASLHGMIEYGDAFGVTSAQLKVAHENVTTWGYTADKNLGPFIEHGLYEENSPRFIKLPNGMEPPTIKAVPRSEIGMPDDAFVLCCVSRAIPDKGWAETIEAVTRAREMSGRDIRLILVGNGPVYDVYCHIGVPEFVYLAGFSENSVGYYAAADMGIMLTKFRSESFPLTIVDCLFAGKPYISCDVGEIQSMLTEGDEVAGAVLSLDDWEVPVKRVAEVIAEFSTDTRQYSDALAVVPRLVVRYRIDNVVERYVDIFQATLAARLSAGLLQTN